MGWDYILLALTPVYFINKLAELRIHKGNYARLSQAGAHEAVPHIMRLYYASTHLIIPAMALERLVSPRSGPVWIPAAGALLAAAAIAIRLWGIASLGSLWTMRCLGFPGLKARALGPYRYLNHPEYLTRTIEGLGLAMLVGAPWSGIGHFLLTTFLAIVVIRAEVELLQEMALAGRPSLS